MAMLTQSTCHDCILTFPLCHPPPLHGLPRRTSARSANDRALGLDLQGMREVSVVLARIHKGCFKSEKIANQESQLKGPSSSGQLTLLEGNPQGNSWNPGPIQRSEPSPCAAQ